MRLSRHARNRVRRIRKAHPAVTPSAILQALLAEPHPRQSIGRRRIEVAIEQAGMVVVLDADDEVVITVWLKER